MWTKTNDYYNREVVTCDVWNRKVPRGKLYLMASIDKNFKYTFSCGANSEYSFSGSFFNTTISTLDEAKEWLNKFVPLHFDNSNGAYQKRRELYDFIKLQR